LLGLGIMGRAIGERLCDRGVSLTVWNRTFDKTAPLAARGARAANTPEDAVAGVHIVALCLRDGAAVEDVLFATHGAARRLTSRSVVVDLSTIGISATRRLARCLTEATASAWVDAPVSGGPAAARAGTLAVFCGGTAGAVARARPLLVALSRQTTHMGPVGAGQATKLCNQLIVSTTIAAIAEAIAAARAFGLDAASLPHALAGGFADSTPLRIFGPRMASQRLEPRLSEIAMMRKDVRLLLEATAEAPLDLRIARATAKVYDLAARRGLAGEDLGALARLVPRVVKPRKSRG